MFFCSFSSLLVNSASPEIRAAGVSFRVDTGTLGTLPLLPGKTCEELFFFFFFKSDRPCRESILFFSPLFFILKTCRRWRREERSEDVRAEDARCFCSVKIPSPRREFKDMHQRRFHVGLFVVYLTLHS